MKPMPRGGYRPGGGRPKGSGRKSVPLDPPAPALSRPVRNSTEQLGDITGVQYLQRLVNDPEATDVRRDRAAGILASIEFRSGQISTGKKAVAEERARLAGFGTHWWALLHDQDAPNFDPNGLTPEDRVEWEAKRRAKAPESNRWDEILNARHNPNGYPYPPDNE